MGMGDWARIDPPTTGTFASPPFLSENGEFLGGYITLEARSIEAQPCE